MIKLLLLLMLISPMSFGGETYEPEIYKSAKLVLNPETKILVNIASFETEGTRDIVLSKKDQKDVLLDRALMGDSIKLSFKKTCALKVDCRDLLILEYFEPLWHVKIFTEKSNYTEKVFEADSVVLPEFRDFNANGFEDIVVFSDPLGLGVKSTLFPKLYWNRDGAYVLHSFYSSKE